MEGKLIIELGHVHVIGDVEATIDVLFSSSCEQGIYAGLLVDHLCLLFIVEVGQIHLQEALGIVYCRSLTGIEVLDFHLSKYIGLVDDGLLSI